jgi:2-oxoglutarate ferredoxin oxidoreductase subunit gamma
VVLINRSLISLDSGRDDVIEIALPIIEIAKDLGNARTANIVALGAFVARSQMVSFDHLRDSVRQEFARKEKLIPINMQALEKGQEAAIEVASG